MGKAEEGSVDRRRVDCKVPGCAADGRTSDRYPISLPDRIVSGQTRSFWRMRVLSGARGLARDARMEVTRARGMAQECDVTGVRGFRQDCSAPPAIGEPTAGSACIPFAGFCAPEASFHQILADVERVAFGE